ncbi:protein SCAR4-like isoform X2 [Herrania umbratica]|uniref:Protein SCAR n=1 Tax=Herrania umbratica TaxID=108875 RepID=A0A6J1ASK3_9ROSI|nr:protein SCAR4-like isoform X2 [Herrania umbratica]
MPLTRYQIRNEYSLADPELYRAADRDDPEALLEGVAMAGLVGVLRQLGDLAEFAAEIFHDLHEEVMATAARGHGLMVRVQQLEAEFPSIEKAFLSQTNHSLFFTNAGVDWHPNLCTEHNLITRGDLPRCVLDSYEECRGPPRLFLLDKFDVAGAGACLKRYTDPSFFKAESAFPEIAPAEVQREKKSRKVKKGLRWRNGETPEIALTSHAKLHQLFLEERIGNAYNDPSRLVKLKRRQLNESPLEIKSGKSYMEKFLESPSPEHKAVYETSGTPPPLEFTLDNCSDSGLEILEISTVSPVKNSSQGKENSSSSRNAQEIVLKPSVEELNREVIDREIVKVPERAADFTGGIPPSLHKVAIEKDIIVDGEGRKECSIDGDHSDDMTSEVDNYMDALTTMESEMDTDNEYRPKSNIGFLNIGKYRADSDATEEKLEVQVHSSDSQSVGISSASDDGNSSFKKGRSSLSSSDTVDNLAEGMPSDGEVAAKEFPSNKNCVAEVVEAPSIRLSASSEMQCSSSDEAWSSKDTSFGECKLPDLGEASYSSCLEELNPTHVLLDPKASSMAVSLPEPQLDEVLYVDVKTNSDLSEMDGGKYLADSSEKQDVTLITLSAESHQVDELDSGDTNVSSDALPHLSNILQLAPEKRSSNDPLDEVSETDFAGETCAENSVNQMIGSPNSVISSAEEQLPCSTFAEVERSSEGLDVMQYVNLASEVNDATLEDGLNSECMAPMVDTSQTCGFNEQVCSDGINDDPQLKADSMEIGASNSEQKQNVDQLFDVAEGEGTGEITCRVSVVGGDAIPCDLPSNSADNLDLNNHVGLDDLATENVRAETMAVLTAACSSANLDDDVDNTTSESSNLICSPSKNQKNLQEPLSGAGDLCQEGLESDEVISLGCLIESEAQQETNQVEGTPADLDSTSCKLVSYDNSNLEDDNHDLSLAEPTKNSLNFVDLTTAPASSELSDQESESKYLSHLIESRTDVVSSPTHCLSEKETSLEQSLDLHTNQHDMGSLQMVEDSSNSLNLLSNQIESLNHIDQERCLQTSSEHSAEGSSSQPSVEFSQQSGRQDKQEMYPSDSTQPAFVLLREATKVSTEEMPPLPPLPPMQWRIGRAQHASPASQRELAEHGQGSFPMIPQYANEQKAQFDLSALDTRNPFLPLVKGEERYGHVCDQLATDFMQPSPFPMDPPTMGNSANSQYDGIHLDRTHPNPFLTLPIISNESHEYGSVAMEDDRVESSYSFLSMPVAEHTTSRHILVSLHEKTTHAPNQFVLDTSLEGGASEHPKQNSEGEHGNPPDIFVAPSTKREEQSPTKVAEELPTKVEERFPTTVGEQHGLAAPEGETTETSNTTVQHDLSTSEGEANGDANGNPTVKLPRPRNPLIDAVAAHDKSKLRKVTERARPPMIPKVDERDSLLEQIRTKSFNLKPAVVTRPSVQGPKTNLRVAAILEKANAIRQALAGSDEDDDEDGWSDS